VLEADEYDHMFLGLQPTVAVITNVEWDHPDCYPTPESFTDAFAQFIQQVQPDGMVISCADDVGAEQLRTNSQISCETKQIDWITYGYSDAATMQAVDPKPVVARWCQVPSHQATAALARFGGTARRFEYKGVINDVLVFDDYAHHPSEIQVTLSAARKRYPERRIWAVFQPHTYSRTREMMVEMAHSFTDADQVLVTDIYSAREIDDGTVKAIDLVKASPHPAIRHTPLLADAVQYLTTYTRPNDIVITLGAGDSYQIGEALLASEK